MTVRPASTVGWITLTISEIWKVLNTDHYTKQTMHAWLVALSLTKNPAAPAENALQRYQQGPLPVLIMLPGGQRGNPDSAEVEQPPQSCGLAFQPKPG